MSTITASMVNELRAKTGQGMMECKKALQESGGDVDKAVEYFRKKGVKSSITERSEFGSMHNGATPDLTSIVGQYFNHAVGDRNEGFLIHDGVFTPLFVTVTGTTLTQAWDINAAGEIVGVYRVGTGQTAVFHGFVTTDGATYVTFDVPVPGAKATRLRGINSRGDIVGAYVSADGKTHGFVATRR